MLQLELINTREYSYEGVFRLKQIGVVGLGVMGKNLALNMVSKGYSVATYDAWEEVVDTFNQAETKNKKISATSHINEFVNSLEKPRRILLMVKAGEVTDDTIASLLPYLEHGDIIIDGGNSFYQDTIRRNKELNEKGINFIGAGVSGGEEGALNGPSLMPGGQKQAYELVAPIFQDIAAKVNGDACTTYIGPDGAGNYEKMVHKGIEYGDMQLICEENK